AAYAGLRAGPVDRLVEWISAPSATNLRTVARAVPMFLLAQATQVRLPDDLRLEDAARAVLLDEALPGHGTWPVGIWRSGACAVAIEPVGPIIKAALLLDDRDGSVDAAHVDS